MVPFEIPFFISRSHLTPSTLDNAMSQRSRVYLKKEVQLDRNVRVAHQYKAIFPSRPPSIDFITWGQNLASHHHVIARIAALLRTEMKILRADAL